MEVNQDLEMNDTPPFEITFWVNETENYTKSERPRFCKYKGLHV